MRLGWAAAIAIAGIALPAQAEVSRAEIDGAIEKGVQAIVSKQDADGHWVYQYQSAGAEIAWAKVGHTALAVLALQHSGSRSPEAALAIKKGLSYIVQSPPEARTYSAGLVMQALYGDRSSEHNREIATQAWMLIGGQRVFGSPSGGWSYELPDVPPQWASQGLKEYFKQPDQVIRFDNSNSQFGILGLVYAEKAGYQVPRIVWERARDFYARNQHADGGWDYLSDLFLKESKMARAPEGSSMSMTLAGTVSSFLCDEMLADKSHKQCKTPAVNKVHEAGLKWIGDNWHGAGNSGYPWYACERLGMLIGYSEFGGHDWYQEGAAFLVPQVGREFVSGTTVENAFMVLFLARGRNPIIINKLKRQGDWNLHRFDVNHLVEHMSTTWQMPCQWRIVTLEAKTEFLLKVPILWISGHEALKFTPEEKAKLKEYVEKGGTILGEDCCSKPAFDASFRALLKELWPDNNLTDLPKTHAIFTSFRKLENKPDLMSMALEKGQGRIGVIYIPHGISCRWEVGGPGSKGWLDVGACIYLYVDKMAKRERAEAQGEK